MKQKYMLWIFIGPMIVTLMAVVAYPIIQAIYTSFHLGMRTRPDLGNPFVGLEHYTFLLESPIFWKSLEVTLLFTGGALGIEMFLGIGIAQLLNRKIRGLILYRGFLILPMFIPPVVVGLLWRFMYNPDLGILNYLLRMLGLGSLACNWVADAKAALFSCIIVDVWEFTPLVLLFVISGLESLPIEPFEAAKIDGASGWQTFWYLTMPMLKPVLMVTLLIRTIGALRIFDTIAMLTQGGPGFETESLTILVYHTGFEWYRIGRASALSVIFLLISAGIALTYMKIFVKEG